MLTLLVFLSIVLIVAFFNKYPFINRKREIEIGISNAILINNFFSVFVPIILVSLLLGLRYNVGIDYLAYKEIYEVDISNDLKWSIENRETEILFTVICVFLHKLNIPYYGMFIIMAIIPLYFFYSSFKRTNYLLVLGIICLILSGVLFMYLNIMRQGIAFFIILYAIQYIIKKSFVKYAFWIIVASGFHITSLLFLPFYYLKNTQKFLFRNRIIAIILFLLSIIFSGKFVSVVLSLAMPFLEETYIQYINLIEDWNMSEGTGLGMIVQRISDLCLIYVSPLCIRYLKNERFDIYYNIYFIGLIFANLAGMNMLLSRVPFCFVSMRFIILSFSFWLIYKLWYIVPTQYKFFAILSMICNILYFIGNISHTDYAFIGS